VSGGGWGVGDFDVAVEQALTLAEVGLVVCLCGRNEGLRDQLRRQFESDGRVRVEGFTDRMRNWLTAADVLVHSTGGLTVLEAVMCGCPAISFGWGRGHIRRQNEAFRRFGLADVASSAPELVEALRRALAKPKRPDRSFSSLPSAASIVLSQASRDGQSRTRADAAEG
ncbi:MAG: glycosyltransferase, partial [Actinobacteria bacterium]